MFAMSRGNLVAGMARRPQQKRYKVQKLPLQLEGGGVQVLMAACVAASFGETILPDRKCTSGILRNRQPSACALAAKLGLCTRIWAVSVRLEEGDPEPDVPKLL